MENLQIRTLGLANKRLSTTDYNTANTQGHTTAIFRKISVRKTILDLKFLEHICCKISCLPASPRIFEHLQNGIITHF